MKKQAAIYVGGIAALGALIYWLSRKRGGALGTVADAVIGAEGIGGLTERIIGGAPIEQVELPPTSTDLHLADDTTSANPSDTRPFVIPITGDILSPREGERVGGIFSGEYSVDCEIQNHTSTMEIGTVDFIATERYLFGEDEVVSKSSETIAIPAGSAKRITLGIPDGSSLHLQFPTVTLDMYWKRRWLSSVTFTRS